eukprot:m.800466 g.800466  ORF g.800466 m.800466 type:complete len:284 (+) comp59267_c1_seq7:1364-2215(+)
MNVDYASLKTHSAGIFDAAACESAAAMQPVLIVGHGSLGPHPFWQVKTSEGPAWGENGSIRIAKSDVNICGLYSAMAVPVFALPTSWDWRDHNAVTPVYNQGQSGDVMVFAATEAVESYHAIHTGQLETLNLDEVNECCGSQELSWDIFDCIAKLGGICSTSASVKSCKAPGCTPVPGTNITGYSSVQSGNETALQVAVLQTPVAAALDAASLETYTSGIYSASCPPTLDHAMLVVGWGVTGNSPYWILKNSWGTSWGMEGYILLARNHHDECGIALNAAYPI